MSSEPAAHERASFFKLSGAGNDFIAFAEPQSPPNPDEIRAWCRRGLAVGADGVFTIERGGGAREGAKLEDAEREDAERKDAGVRMVYANADGERSDLCLNGARCAARLAFHLGWHQSELRLITDVGVLRARRTGEDRVALELPEIVEEPAAKELKLGGHTVHGWHLTVGVPHFVLLWPEPLEAAPVADLGPALRRHLDLAPAGANVNFVRCPAKNRCEIRTYERGVEAETLACGTGIVAAAAAAVSAGRLTLPATVLTAGGFELTVRHEDGEPWILEGDARIVARGELLSGATALPSPPRWS